MTAAMTELISGANSTVDGGSPVANHQPNARLTVLWGRLSGYCVAFLRSLALGHGFSIQLAFRPSHDQAPFVLDLDFTEHVLQGDPLYAENLREAVDLFEPNFILMTSWNYRHYRTIARRQRKRGAWVVATMDNQWRGTARQRAGVAVARWLLHPTIDNLFVTGDRQAEFAGRLGYRRPLYGILAADTSQLSGLPTLELRPRAFLFLGRLVKEKGLDVLIEAYRLYRERSLQPWRLRIAGAGPLGDLVCGEGIERLPFVQPPDLGRYLASGRCLVLPSRFEPWGVVLHEAAAAGLILIATRECGATSAFVRDGINGFVVSNDPKMLAERLLRVEKLNDEALRRQNSVSEKLGSIYSADTLAEYFATELRMAQS